LLPFSLVLLSLLPFSLVLLSLLPFPLALLSLLPFPLALLFVFEDSFLLSQPFLQLTFFFWQLILQV